MGFLDNANDLLNRETAKVGRAAKVASLNSQLKELNRQKSAAMSRLGAALYSIHKDDSTVREPNKALFECIEGIDTQIRSTQFDIAALERQNAIGSEDGEVCPRCGQPITADDAFCPGCGSKLEIQLKAAATGDACPKCGFELGEGEVFCMKCGYKVH